SVMRSSLPPTTAANGAARGPSRAPNTWKRIVGLADRSVSGTVDAASGVALSQPTANVRMLAMTAVRRIGPSYRGEEGPASASATATATAVGPAATSVRDALRAMRETFADARIGAAGAPLETLPRGDE